MQVKARRDAVVRGAAWVGAGWLVAYAVAAWLARDRPALGRFLGDVVYVVPVLFATVLSGLTALRSDRSRRPFWALLAVSNLVWLVGEVLWSVFDEVLRNPLPFPSVADGFYIGSYLLVIPAIVVGARDRRRSVAWRSAGQSLFVLSGLAVAGYTVLIQPQMGGGWSWATATGVAYPLLGLVILCTFAAVTSGGSRGLPVAVWLVVAAFVVSAVTDAAYTYLAVLHEYVSGSMLNLGWQLEAVLLCLGALHQLRHPGTPRVARVRIDIDGALVLAVSGATLLALVLAIRDHDLHPLPAVLAVASVMAAQGRLYIAARRQARANHHQATHDALTGLPNRLLFADRIDTVVASAAQSGRSFAVLLADLNRFKEVNDTLGHEYGDRLLVEVAIRARCALRAQDTIARLGGDELAILMPDTDRAGAVAAAERLVAVLHEPIEVAGVMVATGASIGIVVADADSDPSTILRHADVAMYESKGSHSDYVVYDAGRDQHTPMRLTMLAELRHALTADQLVLHYQPKIALHTGDVIGVEALIRWNHPTRGLVPPAEFIPVAENTGMINALTDRVLGLALTQARAWLDDIGVPVSVNISSRCLVDPRFADRVRDLLRETGVVANLLVLELTESCLMLDPQRALSTLLQLDQAGVQLSIDDFGTGYSSMSYLRELPVRELKIDRSFVADLTDHANDAALVRSAIDLGHNLGLTVVAEGVEDAATVEELRRLGCDVAQGYHFSRPVPADEAAAWIRRRQHVAVRPER